MLKNIFVLILVLHSVFRIYGQEINTYDQMKVGEIKTGKSDEQLGFDSRFLNIDAHTGPSFMSIDEKGFFYIVDDINHRINLYNDKLNHVKSLKSLLKYKIYHADALRISDGIVAFLVKSKFLGRMLLNGDVEFTIKKKDLSLQVRTNSNFFLFNEFILYYDYDTEENIFLIDAKGSLLNSIDKENILKKSFAVEKKKFEEHNKIFVDAYFSFVQSKKIVIHNQKMLTTDIYIERFVYISI